MKIALVGAGEVGLCVAKESDDEVVVLTGTIKLSLKNLKAEIRLTDYSVDVLRRSLDDCDVVVSTLSGPSEFCISAHTCILEACSQSRRCKHFIPSEWNINIEDFPDQPMFSAARMRLFATSWALSMGIRGDTPSCSFGRLSVRVHP